MCPGRVTDQWDEAHQARHQSSKTKFYDDDVIMMVIESDSRVMTEVTLHTIFIYITLGREDKLDIALIHLLKL